MQHLHSSGCTTHSKEQEIRALTPSYGLKRKETGSLRHKIQEKHSKRKILTISLGFLNQGFANLNLSQKVLTLSEPFLK